MVFSGFINDVVKKESRQTPLELLACDLVVGVHPASKTSNLKKGVNTYIWMKLNTNDGNKIKLWILLLTHFKLSFRVAPLILGCLVVDEPGNNYCGDYICEFIRHTTCERGYSKNNMKCVSNNIHNFTLLPSFVLSFIHIHVLTHFFKLDVRDAGWTPTTWSHIYEQLRGIGGILSWPRHQ